MNTEYGNISCFLVGPLASLGSALEGSQEDPENAWEAHLVARMALALTLASVLTLG
jgi:hypothetical protein